MWYLACLFATMAVAATTPYTPIGENFASESDLRRIIFQNYDKLVRPVKNYITPVTLSVSFSPIAIREVDERNQVLVVDSWILLKWKDEAFSWDPQAFGNLSVMRIPSSEVWKPDLSVYTATPESSLFPTSATQVLIYSNTDVLWVPMFTIRSRCPMSRRSDKSTLVCSIKMGSWTYSGPLLDLQLLKPEVDLSNFQDIHPDWKLQGVESNRQDNFYPCCTEPYPSVYFNMTLKRRDGMRLTNKNEVWSSLSS